MEEGGVIKASDAYDILTEYLEHPGIKYELAILTTDPIEGVSYVNIAGVCSGMDGRQNILMFRPAEPVTPHPRRMLDINPAVVKRIDKRGFPVHGCPVCLKKVSAPDRYCRYCGTKLRDDSETQKPCKLCAEKKQKPTKKRRERIPQYKLEI